MSIDLIMQRVPAILLCTLIFATLGVGIFGFVTKLSAGWF